MEIKTHGYFPKIFFFKHNSTTPIRDWSSVFSAAYLNWIVLVGILRNNFVMILK